MALAIFNKVETLDSMSYMAVDSDKACRSSSRGSSTSAGSASRASSPGSTGDVGEWIQDEYDLLSGQCTFAEWTVTIERVSGGKLGFRTTPTRHGSALGVLAIVPDGQLQEWNEENAENHIRLGDMVLEVNGVSGNSQQMLDELIKAPTVLEMRLARAVRLPAVLDRHGSSAGLGLTLKNLHVEKVEESLKALYKNTVPAELRIWAGDQVVLANGRRHQPDVELQLAKAIHVELTLRRPAPGTVEAAAVVGTAATAPAAKGAQTTKSSQSFLKAMSSSWPLSGKRQLGNTTAVADLNEPLL